MNALAPFCLMEVITTPSGARFPPVLLPADERPNELSNGSHDSHYSAMHGRGGINQLKENFAGLCTQQCPGWRCG